MGVWRKWIFPSLRIAVALAIAVALVKLAFFPASAAEAIPPVPTGSVGDQIITVTTDTIKNEIVLDGSIVADPAVPAKSGMLGEVGELHVATGAVVEAGAVVATIRKEIEQEPIIRTDAEGNTTTVQPKPKYTYGKVTAPAAGIVSGLPMVVGQSVSVGDTVAQIAPSTFSVTGTIEPAQQFRLEQQPTEAQVSVLGGPDAFTCTGLTILTPLAGATPNENETGAGNSGGTGPQVKCAVPADIRVFAGLTGKITLPGASAENVLALPVTAVKGSSQSGTVWVVNEEGVHEERAVGLGLNNGSLVQITEGLAEGDSVLEFIPVTDPTNGGTDEDCFSTPSGETVCGAQQ